mmetsp:Transcript_42407/g.95711  ORF Transcript_42407/g.95711 Transcript_42407/m.95711 type:complete len:230 (+) Transcript_42407:216-905(+)
MLRTGRPSRAMLAAKSTGWGNSRIERSRYWYSSPPEPRVATLPMAGTTCVMKAFATRERNVEPSGKENSRMQTRLEARPRKALLISRKARARSGTLRMPKDIEILSMEPDATPALGAAKVPSLSMPRTSVRFCASPFTRRMTPLKPRSSTLATPRRSISELGSTPSTESARSVPSPSSLRRLAARSPTSAVPVAKSSTRSPRSRRMHSLIRVLRQNWSRPRDIHLLVES